MNLVPRPLLPCLVRCSTTGPNMPSLSKACSRSQTQSPKCCSQWFTPSTCFTLLESQCPTRMVEENPTCASDPFNFFQRDPKSLLIFWDLFVQCHAVLHERVEADYSPQFSLGLVASLQHPEYGPLVGNSIVFSQNVSLFRSDYFEFSLFAKLLQIFTASSCQWM